MTDNYCLQNPRCILHFILYWCHLSSRNKCLKYTLRKFHVNFCHGIFLGKQNFPIVSGGLRNWNPGVSTKFPQLEIRWNYGTFRSDRNTSVQLHSNVQMKQSMNTKIIKSNQEDSYLPLIVSLTNVNRSTMLFKFIFWYWRKLFKGQT